MDKNILIRKGIESSRPTFIPKESELIWTTDTNKLYMGDGFTAGGLDFITDAQGDYIPLSQKGTVNGVATLGVDQKIPLSQLKIIDDTNHSSDTTYSSVKITTLLTTGVAYLGHWNASTNVPTLQANVGTSGHYYIVDTAGTQDLGQGLVTFGVGDFAIYTDDDGEGGVGGVWEKSINSNKVDEVNGQIGLVTLDAGHIYMTGYVIPAATGSIGALDTVRAAIGKLERGLDDAVAGGGDVNVQSDWAQIDTNSDDYIKNKAVTITLQQADDIVTNNLKRSYPEVDQNKLATIDINADANVNPDWDATSGHALILNKPPIVYDFMDLMDTTDYSLADADKVIAVNPTGDGLVYTSVELVGGGSTTWIGLSDTPGALGESTIAKGTRVNATGTGLEYVDRKISTQDDVNIINIQVGELLTWDGIEFTNSPPVDGSQLQILTESTKTGWRLLDKDPANYGDIGFHAIDLSYSHIASTLYGATGDYSIAVGSRVQASGKESTAMGYQTTASGDFGSHAEGINTIASGAFGSHAEGRNTLASGEYGSHAEGENTVASGFASHAEGRNTTAGNNYMHAAGYYNVGTSGNTIHETGIGDSTTPANAFEIYTDGTITAPEATNTLINLRGDKTLITKEYLIANAGGTDRTVEKITADGITDAYTLVSTYELGFETLVDVFVDRLLQIEGDDYTLTLGNTVTFTYVPSNDSLIIIKILG